MATYSDGKTEAMEGDVVEVVCSPWNNVSSGDRATINAPVNGECVRAMIHSNKEPVWWRSDRFKLISRAPSPAKAEPLVKWPEEDKQQTFNLIREGDWFVWVSVPQKACIRHAGGKFAYLAKPGELMNGNNDEPVCRLRMTQPPQFIVI